MELVLDVETGGVTRRVKVGLDLAESRDLLRVVAMCGVEPLQRLSSGVWDNTAAKAVIYVNLLRALSDGEPEWANPPFEFSEMDFDWGLYSEFMVDPDPQLEASLAAISEATG